MKPVSRIESTAVADEFNGALRRYLNCNWMPTSGAGKWLFGALPDNCSGDGLQWVWTDDERQALADCGEVAAMLGLGSGKPVSASMVSPRGTFGASVTLWDSVLEQVPGGTHASGVLCRRSQKRKGGKFDVIRNDGARLELSDLW